MDERMVVRNVTAACAGASYQSYHHGYVLLTALLIAFAVLSFCHYLDLLTGGR